MKRFKSLIVAVCAVTISVASVLPALPTSAATSASIGIVPKKNYTIESGKTIKDTLVISNNDSGAPLEVSLRVVDFTFRDDTGTPQLLIAEDAAQTPWSLKPMLTLPDHVTIAPGQRKSIDISITIPASHTAGSYYSAIMASSGSPVDGGNVDLSASVSTLVFASIPGDVDEKLSLEKFGAYRQASGEKDAGYAKVMTDMPTMMAYTLKNEGNVVEAPVGHITIKNIFGKETRIENVNPNGSVSLIGQTRTFTACMKLKSQEVDFNGSESEADTCASPALWPGYYSAELNLFYGQNGNVTQEVSGTTSFWYLPWWFIMAVTAIIAAVTYFIWRIVRAIKSKFGHTVSLKKTSRRR